MTIEELDDPGESRAETASPHASLTRVGRRQVSAVVAGLLIGAGAYGVASPVASDVPVRDRTSVSAPTPTATGSCQPTTSRDSSGVLTVDGKVGVIGETLTRSGEGSILVVRRGTIVGDLASLQFTQIGTSAPATWVQYSSAATEQPSKTPWAVVRHSPRDGNRSPSGTAAGG